MMKIVFSKIFSCLRNQKGFIFFRGLNYPTFPYVFFNNDKPPSWLKTFFEAQLSMQRKAQEQNAENQRKMQQINERFLQQ